MERGRGASGSLASGRRERVAAVRLYLSRVAEASKEDTIQEFCRHSLTHEPYPARRAHPHPGHAGHIDDADADERLLQSTTETGWLQTLLSGIQTTNANGVYASRGTNPTSNLADGIFADSLSSELVTPSGSPSNGYAATWQVGVST